MYDKCFSRIEWEDTAIADTEELSNPEEYMDSSDEEYVPPLCVRYTVLNCSKTLTVHS